jgi:hypothetical protein
VTSARMEHPVEVVAAVLKAAPPISVSGLLVFGIPVKDVVVIITGLYTLTMFAHLLWKWRREWKETRP